MKEWEHFFRVVGGYENAVFNNKIFRHSVILNFLINSSLFHFTEKVPDKQT